MTNYIFPAKGGKQWRINGRTIGFWLQIDEIGFVNARLFEEEKDTGWIPFALIRQWNTVSDFNNDCLAIGGMGKMLFSMIALAEAAIADRLSTALPALNNSTPPSVDGFNYAIAEYTDIIPPQAGQTAPQIMISYLIPAGVAAYPSSITPAPP